jgi:DNA/RNA-binding domain of Phe-tRNA-synthetase-like protein
MYFEHTDQIWKLQPGLSALTVVVAGVRQMQRNEEHRREWLARTEQRLASGPESSMPEIAAWRDTFGKMGLKPTQYRCASEALLRRYRKEQSLPSLHPLIDLLNVVSMAYALPIAVFDCAKIGDGIVVRPASGNEIYETFQGEKEHPVPNEIIFADQAGNAHSRRWTHRQSARSAVNDTTTTALIVAEALHAQSHGDIAALERELTPQLQEAGLSMLHVMKIDAERRRLEF